jgi:hypothetical protein
MRHQKLLGETHDAHTPRNALFRATVTARTHHGLDHGRQ